MKYRRLPIAALAAGPLLLATIPAHAAQNALRVCADPDYMPFSNQAKQGFENKIAELLAKDMGRTLEYTWASYRGHGGFSNFLASTLDAHKCDVVMSLPYGDNEEGYTKPYYTSSYVFISKKDKNYNISSMTSPALRTIKIGFEDDTTPELALKVLGLTDNGVPFDVGENPNASPKSMLQAVEDGKVGVMITWEPAIGYFLKDYPNLTVSRVPSEEYGPGLPAVNYTYAMSIGVRKDDSALKAKLDSTIAANKTQIDGVLTHYGVKLYSSAQDQTNQSY